MKIKPTKEETHAFSMTMLVCAAAYSVIHNQECRYHGILDLTYIVHFLDVTETRSANESENTGILTNQVYYYC